MRIKQGPAFVPGHLYVADSYFYSAAKIYRYPLNAQGLPSTMPDGELTVGILNPGSIAVGPDGSLYVTSSGTPNGCRKRCFVAVYAPLASHHAKPVRILDVPQRPLYVAVDQQGYLDVSVQPGVGNTTNVYAPNASGHDPPVNELTTPGVNALAAANGLAYVQTLRPGTGIEAVPEVSASPPPVYYTYGRNFSADGVAIDGPNLYAQFFWQQRYKYLLATAVYLIGQPGPPIRTIVGTGCKVSRNGGALGYGLAVYKKYLYEGCIGIGGLTGSVLVYSSGGNGKERPVETISGGDAGVALGP